MMLHSRQTAIGGAKGEMFLLLSAGFGQGRYSYYSGHAEPFCIRMEQNFGMRLRSRLMLLQGLGHSSLAAMQVACLRIAKIQSNHLLLPFCGKLLPELSMICLQIFPVLHNCTGLLSCDEVMYCQ